jgi:hypothetical protein
MGDLDSLKRRSPFEPRIHFLFALGIFLDELAQNRLKRLIDMGYPGAVESLYSPMEP